MCGLVGIIGKYLNKNDISFMEEALYCDALRGMHSTGLAALYQKHGYNHPRDWKSSVYKRVGSPMEYFKLDAYTDFLETINKNNVHALMGHNRFATQGSITDNNAHPFINEHVILAHNGTLKDWNDLPDAKYFTVDSECIAHSMATIGVEDTIARLDGAFALSWIDLSEGTLNLVRNQERPLSLFLNEQMNRAAYGSEAKMIEWLSDRNKMGLSQEYSIEAGKWHVFDLNESSLKEFQVYDVELYKPIYYQPPSRIKKKKNTAGGRKQSFGNFPHNNLSDKRVAKASNLLRNYGLDYHQEILFTATELLPYDKSNPNGRGRLDGYLDEEPFLCVEVHGVYPDQFTAGEYYRTYATNVINPDSYDVISGTTITHVPNVEENKSQKEEINRLADNEGEEEQKLLEYNDSGKVYTDPSGSKCNEQQMDFYTRYGCCSCQGNIDVTEYGDINWTENQLPMCSACYLAWTNIGIKHNNKD